MRSVNHTVNSVPPEFLPGWVCAFLWAFDTILSDVVTLLTDFCEQGVFFRVRTSFFNHFFLENFIYTYLYTHIHTMEYDCINLRFFLQSPYLIFFSVVQNTQYRESCARSLMANRVTGNDIDCLRQQKVVLSPDLPGGTDPLDSIFP